MCIEKQSAGDKDVKSMVLASLFLCRRSGTGQSKRFVQHTHVHLPAGQPPGCHVSRSALGRVRKTRDLQLAPQLQLHGPEAKVSDMGTHSGRG